MNSSIFSQSKPFKLVSEVQPAGDQIAAIDKLVEGLEAGKRDQVLLGVTGSGKTFTMANTIARTQRPAVIMAHNKTLAAQLFNEMRLLFPENAVEYFVSYYDYYQPEAYIAKTDTYIEKSSLINKKIEILRHSSTRSLIERRDVVIITSVSSIYGIGSPEYYSGLNIELNVGESIAQDLLLRKLIKLNYQRNEIDFDNGKFRVIGDYVDIFPPYSEDNALRVVFEYDEVVELQEFDALTGQVIGRCDRVVLYPSSHHATPHDVLQNATKNILAELGERLDFFRSIGKHVEAQRLEQRTRYDIEMMMEIGHLKGIENYSRHIEGRNPGEPPHTLFSYLPDDAIVFVDESHATLPQIRAMFAGDESRKQKLVEFGFRLPSAMDNRPLKFDEWDAMRSQTIYVSATPAKHELALTGGVVVEQIIRPTGLVDPVCEIRPLENHFDDLISEIRKTTAAGLGSIVIVLTKKMAEKTHAYFQEVGLRSMYIHSATETLERVEIIQMLREGEIEVVVGINLLREGIDVPECGLVAITDADKEGFLRSQTSLIQIVGRAARNTAGRVIFYADRETEAMKRTIEETNRRRELQIAHNTKHGIVPRNLNKATTTVFKDLFSAPASAGGKSGKGNTNTNTKAARDKIAKRTASLNNEQARELVEKEMARLTKEMKKAAKNLDFETATELRKKIKAMQSDQMLNII